jgi:RHS repeat-associated protein
VKKVVGTSTTIFVYNAGGQLIAEYTSPDTISNNGLSYLTSDHLGSTRVVTDINGFVKSRHDYLPFGEEIGTDHCPAGLSYGATDGERQKFTQKERDSESGLDYFLARYYSPAQGRFLSTDRLQGGTSDPQSWNLYVYVTNNPLKYVDPFGLWKQVAPGVWQWQDGDDWKSLAQKTGIPKNKLKGAFDGTGLGPGSAPIDVNNLRAGHANQTYASTDITPLFRGVGNEMNRGANASRNLIGGFAVVTYGAGAAVGASVYFAPAIAELIRRALNEAARVDPNKLNHIFGEAEHNLGNLVSEFGSEESAFNAVQRAAETVVKSKGLQGVFEETVRVGTETVTVRGAVVNGVVKIGTAFKP